MYFEQISLILSQPAWDVVVLLFFLVSGIVYGMVAGRGRLLAIFVALYISQLLFAHLSYFDAFVAGRGFLAVFVFRTIAFIALFLLIAVLFAKTVFRAKDVERRVISLMILSLLETGLFISVVVRLLPERELFTLSPLVARMFANDAAYFWWLVLPLVAFPFVARRGRIENRRV